MFARIWVLIVKEFFAIWRDPKGRVILIVPPVVQMLIFSFAATQEVKNVPIAILNKDGGGYARDLAARVAGSPNFSRVSYLHTDAEAAELIDAQRALLVVHIDVGFSRQVARGEPATVQLLLDGRRANAAGLVASYATEIVSRYVGELGSLQAVAAPGRSFVTRAWFNSNLQATWSTVPALVAILSTVIGLMVTGLSVAREREVGTFDQLLVSPLSPTEILIGKSLPALLIGMFEATAMIIVGVLFIGVPFRGSVLLLYGSLFVYLLSIIGIGLFISSLAKTQQQAILYCFMFMVPAVLLSGFASPIGNMPQWLQAVTMANPVRHFMVILKGLFLKDTPASFVLRNTFPMALIAVVTLSTASFFFRRRME